MGYIALYRVGAMFDVVAYVFSWLVLIVFGGQVLIFIGLVTWMVWTDAIKPRLIPAAEIDRVADGIIAGYPDPGRKLSRGTSARGIAAMARGRPTGIECGMLSDGGWSRREAHYSNSGPIHQPPCDGSRLRCSRPLCVPVLVTCITRTILRHL